MPFFLEKILANIRKKAILFLGYTNSDDCRRKCTSVKLFVKKLSNPKIWCLLLMRFTWICAI